jgi:hypothetical protein
MPTWTDRAAMHRNRSAKILATLGPATSGAEGVRTLHEDETRIGDRPAP